MPLLFYFQRIFELNFNYFSLPSNCHYLRNCLKPLKTNILKQKSLEDDDRKKNSPLYDSNCECYLRRRTLKKFFNDELDKNSLAEEKLGIKAILKPDIAQKFSLLMF